MLYIKTQNKAKIFVEGFTKIKTAKKRLSQRGLEEMKVKTIGSGSGLKHHMILSYPEPCLEWER